MKDRIFIGDRYEVLSKVGAGGMADVYKGKDHKLNRFVAIKILKKEFREDKTFVEKFQSEAQAAAGLMHPNIVNVYDVGEEQGLYFMVMELVEGITLKEYIHKKGSLSAKETISIAIQAANGIEAAHMHQIVHRDIKPQNIMISKEGKVKVTDFGIAKAASSNTISTNVLGSVHYTSPEQARGGYSDYKSDIYSLGITMYEMVTGTLPFDGDSAVAVAIKQLQEEITPPSERMEGIPYSLEQIILKCTQKNADRRYPNIKALREDLKRSLVDPDGDFVTIGPMRVADETVLFNANDVNRVKNEAGRYRMMDDEYDDEYDDAYDEDSYDDEYDDYGDDEYEDDDYDDRRRGKNSDVNPKMTKLIKILTIVAVVIIAFVVIFIVGRATGLLKFGPSAITEEEKKEVKVPKLVGKTKEEAEKALKTKGLTLKVKAVQESSEYEKGYVISQDPKEGTKVKKESVVTVIVSSGKTEEEIEVPDVSGKSQDEARDELEALGFKVSVSPDFEASEEFEQDEVIRTTPSEGTMAAKGSEITLIISSGEDKPEIPNLLGKSEREAASILNGLSINYTSEEVYNDSYEKGKVCYQSKKAGTRVERGSSISIQISKGKKPEEKATVPPVIGNTLDAAKSLISSAGLETGTIKYEFSDKKVGTVISVSPGEGSSVSMKTKINLVVSKGPEPTPDPEPENPDNNGPDNGEDGNTDGENGQGTTW